MKDTVRKDQKSGRLIEQAHARLKNDIILGRHQPGEKLRVEHLRREYGVSSSTLREALTMLIADGLVVSEWQRGFRVKPVSAADLIDLNRIRILLEKDAIKQAIANGDEEWEGSVVSSYHILCKATTALKEFPSDKERFDEWERRHRSFHTTLFSAAPSEWAQYFLTIAYQQCERYRHIFHVMTQGIYDENRTRAIDEEHANIVEAVLARDADKAAELLEKHLMTTLDEWVEFFEKTEAFDSLENAFGKVDKADNNSIGER